MLSFFFFGQFTDLVFLCIFTVPEPKDYEFRGGPPFSLEKFQIVSPFYNLNPLYCHCKYPITLPPIQRRLNLEIRT